MMLATDYFLTKYFQQKGLRNGSIRISKRFETQLQEVLKEMGAFIALHYTAQCNQIPV